MVSGRSGLWKMPNALPARRKLIPVVEPDNRIQKRGLIYKVDGRGHLTNPQSGNRDAAG